MGNTVEMLDGSTKEYLSCAETAKLVRSALKQRFPGVKFGVRSKTYSCGASISVSWMDGPTTKAVDEVVQLYSGASFDGMIDLKTHHDSILVNEAGEPRHVSFGADFIFSRRELSDEAKAEVAAVFERKWGKPYEPNDNLAAPNGVLWALDEFYRLSGEMTFS
jgi:hypothetical protein